MEDLVLGVIIGIIFGIFFGVISIGVVLDNDISELGQSICDQEYDMDYQSYSDGKLKCKPKEIKEEVQYDGIVIQIKEV